MKEILRELVCVLDEAELNERGLLMSTTMLRYDEVEMAKKEAMKDYSEEMKALRGKMRELSKNIRSRSEIRTVKCGIAYNSPQPGMKRIVRLDTGELLSDEQMTEDERQNSLFDIDDLKSMYGEGAPPDSGEGKPPAPPAEG